MEPEGSDSAGGAPGTSYAGGWGELVGAMGKVAELGPAAGCCWGEPCVSCSVIVLS